jgi:alginate O-acetyltransferase complex protein AlgI
MLFHSLGFLLFVTVVFAVHHGLLSQPRSRKTWLLVASWVYYATWSAPFLVLFVVTTVANFVLAGAIGARVVERDGAPSARALFVAGLIVN